VPPIAEHVTLGPSRKLCFALVAVHLTACAVPWQLGMAPLAAAAVSLMVLTAGWCQVRRHALRRSPEAERELVCRSDGQVLVRMQDGREFDCRLEAAPVTAASWVMLRLRQPDGARRAVHLVDDACSPDAHRRLRVFLRWALQPGEDSPVRG